MYDNLFSCSHQADTRKAIEYGRDLVASWIFEDLFVWAVNCDDVRISLSGADRNRIILPNQRVSSTSDCTVWAKGKKIGVEIVNDYTGFWCRNGKLHLRDNKYLKLKNEQNLLLAISIDNASKYTIFDFRKDVPYTYIELHKWWNKPAYELPVNKDAMIDFTRTSIRNSILNII